MAAGAETATTFVTDATLATETAPSTDSPAADDPHSHIQRLLDGLPDDLTAEQRGRSTAFIQSRANVFSRSECDNGRTRIIPHRIDTGDNTPHFEQSRRHSTTTTQLPMIDEHILLNTYSHTMLSSPQRRRGVRTSLWIDEILRRLQKSQRAHQKRQVPFAKDRYLSRHLEWLPIL